MYNSTMLKKLVPVFIKDLIKDFLAKSRQNMSDSVTPENWHVKFIQNLAILMKVQVYAELGIYEGETFNAINAETKIAVDIDSKYLSFADKSPSNTSILGDSLVLAEYLKTNSIELDMLFIDANHSCQAVFTDFKALESFVKPNGIILMHDTFPKSREYSAQEYCGDAFMALDDLTHEFKNWNFATIPVHPGITLATRLPNRPHWALNHQD